MSSGFLHFFTTVSTQQNISQTKCLLNIDDIDFRGQSLSYILKKEEHKECDDKTTNVTSVLLFESNDNLLVLSAHQTAVQTYSHIILFCKSLIDFSCIYLCVSGDFCVC